jgi:hypothetical protein
MTARVLLVQRHSRAGGNDDFTFHAEPAFLVKHGWIARRC